MTQDRRFKHRVRRRMRETGETYSAALAAERLSRPPPVNPQSHRHRTHTTQETSMDTRPAVATRMRGIWIGSTNFDRSREFYERIGAWFDEGATDKMMHGTLAGIGLIFEPLECLPARDSGPIPLLDVTDADELHDALLAAGCDVLNAPRNEPWGRQFDVLDPDGYHLALIGPLR